MATRGCVGVVQGDTFRGVYNHWDSYPQGLGIDVQDKLIEEVEKGKTLEQICSELLQYTTWEEYCRQGICKYCGQKGSPHSISALLVSPVRKLRNANTQEKLEIYWNIKKYGYPDPQCKWHKHDREPSEPPDKYQVTEDNVDDFGIEYMYLIDPVKEELVVVCTYTGKEVKIPIKKILKRKVNWNYVARKLI